MKYFIYVRKSTESEDRQILSIEAQLRELRDLAQKEQLEIAASFEEAKTAKEPGRSVFAEMLARIEKGEEPLQKDEPIPTAVCNMILAF